MIQLPALKRPTRKAIQKKLPWVKSIERDISTAKKVEVEFVSVLQGSESYISYPVYESRLKDAHTSLGFQHALWIEEHQDEFPELKTLRESGIWYIDFTGMLAVDDDGDRNFPSLGRVGLRWELYRGWLGHDFSSLGRVAAAGKSLKTQDTRTIEPFDPSDLEKRIKALEDWKERVITS